MSIAQALLPEFDHEMQTTRTMLERVPEGKKDWKPHEKSMSMGQLAAHVGEVPMWVAPNGGQVFFTMPRVAVIRTFVMNHLIHHRGQLSVYLRLAGVPVPSTYGPSADEGSM